MPNKIKSARDKIKEKKDQLRASLFEIAQKRRELPYKKAAQSYYDDAEKANQEKVVIGNMNSVIKGEHLPTKNPLSYTDIRGGLGVTVTSTPVKKQGAINKMSLSSSLYDLNETLTDKGEYFKNTTKTPYGDIVGTDYKIYGEGSSYGTSYPSFGNLPSKSFNYGSGYSPRDKSLFRLFTEAYINKK